MKRLAWLLLAVFCTALAQVQPVGVAVTKANDCDCCAREARACGMPECPAPAVTAQSGLVLEASAPSLRAEARNTAGTPRAPLEFFPTRFSPGPTAGPVTCATARAARAARVPLFKAHRSFLI